jgi:hypothetical protein
MATYIISVKVDGESKRALVGVQDESKVAELLENWANGQSDEIEIEII